MEAESRGGFRAGCVQRKVFVQELPGETSEGGPVKECGAQGKGHGLV